MELKEKDKITLNEYELTNIDTESRCFTIRLKNDGEYIVYSRKLANQKKPIHYIKKDGKEFILDEAVVKLYISEVREYNRYGI